LDREERANALRPIVEEAVKRTSLRKVAKDIGVSHGTLHNFLEKGYVPYGDTLTKIERWASRHAPEEVEVDLERDRLDSLLNSPAALYATLSDFGPPGEAAEDKLALIELVSLVAARLRRQGRQIPVDHLTEAHGKIIRGEI